MWRKAQTYRDEALRCHKFMHTRITRTDLTKLEDLMLIWYRTPDMDRLETETCERVDELPKDAVITAYRLDIWNGKKAILHYPTYDITDDSFEFDICNEDGEELGPATFSMKEIEGLARRNKKIIVTDEEVIIR